MKSGLLFKHNIEHYLKKGCGKCISIAALYKVNMGGVHMIIVIMRVGFATTVLGMGYDNRMHRNMMYLVIFSSYCILVIF